MSSPPVSPTPSAALRTSATVGRTGSQPIKGVTSFAQMLGAPARMGAPSAKAPARTVHSEPRPLERREPKEAAEPRHRKKDATIDPLDPATRQAAQFAPPAHFAAPEAATDAVAPRARVSIEELLPQLVKRIAWAGDRRRGSVQMELGSGRHAGTTITVHADEGRVRVELRGVDVAELRERIDARLRRHGLDVVTVE